jgi:large repetitive protein
MIAALVCLAGCNSIDRRGEPASSTPSGDSAGAGHLQMQNGEDVVEPTITGPAHDARLAGTVSLAVTVPADSGVTRVMWLVDESELVTVKSAPWSAAWQTTQIEDGPHVLVAKAGDAEGHWATSSSVGVWVDNDASTGAVDTAITGGPRATNLVSPTFTFASELRTATFRCQLDGLPWMPCASPLTLPALAEGPHRLGVTAYSPSGESDPSPADVSFVVDTRAPTVTLTAPAQAEHVTGTVPVSVSVRDESPVTAVRWYVNGVEAAYDGDGEPWNRPWDSRTLANGTYRMFAKARDAAGNWGTSPLVDVIVAN